MEVTGSKMPARFPDVELREDSLNVGHPWLRGSAPGMAATGADDICITGMSGRLPESANLQEFKDNLYNHVDMVTADDRRWPPGLYGLPPRHGKLKDLSRFDATFFGVHAKQAEVMCPQLRLLLESTFEALMDAGVNPEEIKGSRTGVFIGVSASESGEYFTAEEDRVNGYGLTGSARAMFPNRISYTFDLKGPSFAIDTACSSSMLAFHEAVLAIRAGECDAAFVGGSNLNLKPCESLQFHRLSMLSPDGACKAFDSSGNGYVRSEACVMVFLQKATNAKRIYATVVNTGTNTDGFKGQGITFPNGEIQRALVEKVFAEAGVSPSEVSYVEAHGTGTKVGDPQEVNNIAEVFCKGRTTPLLIGSVKSNMGHSEPASGLCSLAKVLIAMETGVIPANLHFKSPNTDIPGLVDGRLAVVDKNWEWNGGLTAINSFGFGGANVHIILRSHNKPKQPLAKDNVPRLICVSGRTTEGVNKLINKLETMPRDDDLITLLHDIHKQNIVGHPYRGYTVLGASNPIRECDENAAKKEIWYVFSGMGTQWAGMGRAFMCLQPFNKAIHRCAAALSAEGLDLLNLINNGTEETFDNILNNFVSIACIQVALVDTLTALGIKPDKIIGHSAGELGCAYADGAFTAEQTALAAYWRGKSILDAKLKIGAMAAVGLTWEEAKKQVPEDVFPACHNGEDSVTVSGPVPLIDAFVKKLSGQGVFAKKVLSSGVAFHSKYIADAGPKLRSSLEKIIPAPKQRSKRWLSSSIPEEGWGSQLAAFSSAAYHVNNLLSPVLFHEVVTKIPENSLIIEIAPHSLLQAVLKRAVPKNCINIGLTKKGLSDEVGNFMANIGKIYLAGQLPNLSVFHKPTSFPVARNTPMIGSLVEWDHSTEWTVADFGGKSGSRSGEAVIEVNLANEADSYITGHTIDGRVLFPATGYLTLVWKAFAKLQRKSLEEVPIVMKDITILRATIMPKEGSVKFHVNIFDGSGAFELTESGSPVVTGHIFLSEGIDKDGTQGLQVPAPLPSSAKTDPKSSSLSLKKGEVYRDFRLRGYDYGGVFQGVRETDNYGTNGKLEWVNNWISFMDTMLQFSLIGLNTRELYVPTRILKVVVDPIKHLTEIGNKDEVKVQMYRNLGITRSGGVEIRGMKASLAPRRTGTQVQAPPKLENYLFCPYENNKEMKEFDALTIALQTVLENSKGARKLKVVEIANGKTNESVLSPTIANIVESEPLTTVELLVATPDVASLAAVLDPLGAKTSTRDFTAEPVDETEAWHVVCGSRLMRNLANAIPALKAGGFVLTKEEKGVQIPSHKAMYGLTVVSKQTVEDGIYILLRKAEEVSDPLVINISQKDFKWLDKVKEAMKESEKMGQRVIIVSDKEPDCGIIGMFNCIKQEAGGENFRCVFVADTSSKPFKITDYQEQMDKDLLVNVLKNNVWGCMRHVRAHTDDITLKVEHAYVNALTRGDLSSLRWIEGPNSYNVGRPDLNPGAELCTVYYAPLNFKDIMLASGKLPPDSLPGHQAEMECLMGLEFAGRDSKGRRVMGCLEAKALATSVLADPDFLWPIPAKWSLEEASTIPCVFATAYYSLMIRGKMKKGDSLLVHAGTGGVGQASLNIALHMGVEVFTTVGSPAKKEFLLKKFPKLKPENIGNSRDTSFEQMIMERTNGRGVDLVLNSLADDKLMASVRCVAEHGKFLEIGKLDLSNNTALGMAFFLKNVSFHGILLDALFNVGSECADKMEVVKLLSQGIESGAVQPLEHTTFSESQIEQAFRFMASGKHIGKVVIKVKQEEENKLVKDCRPQCIAAIPKTYMNPDKSYIVVGGLGGFGLELCQWMIKRGARHIVLTSRSGVTQGYQALCIRRWAEKGTKVHVSTTDCTTEKGATKLIQEASNIAPVGGIFNLAAVLRDKQMENLTVEDFSVVCQAKVDSTAALDKASRASCTQLDYFVVFSSVSCGRGNGGQANYGMANSAMERICESRQAAGLPATAIQWGAIGDVGLVIEGLKGDNETIIGGTLPQRITSCMATMDLFLQNANPVVASMVVAETGGSRTKGAEVSLLDAIGNILGIKDHSNVANSSSLADLGMDSLMGAEIKQTLERNFDVVMSAAEIRNLTVGTLREMSGGGAPKAPAKSDEKTAVNGVDSKQVKFQGDSLMPKETLVKMASGNPKSIRPPIFLVHAIEGTVSSLGGIAKSLEGQETVYGLQCTADVPIDSMASIAQHYIKEIRKIQKQGPYRIVGYSFGAGVAFEMGVQLEKAGDTVTLVLLDGSPLYVASHTGNYKDKRNKAAGDADALAYFIFLFTTIDSVKVTAELQALPDLKARVKYCADKLKGVVPFSEKEVSQAAESFYKKLYVADCYEPSGKIKGEVTLVKAKDNYVVGGDSDYGLKSLCQKSLKMEVLPGDHRGILVGDSGKKIAQLLQSA
ncbi:hypothetical protein GE061_003330 [Apolygus lucorum]|uniref:Fatty acid synthase n=1 Tax=Apolygus lucorum TaxID=248454 RepID=A0A8S9X1V1_APOLU|nr:hypothetical protein GE061_003330 [Apolygus lucorum]